MYLKIMVDKCSNCNEEKRLFVDPDELLKAVGNYLTNNLIANLTTNKGLCKDCIMKGERNGEPGYPRRGVDSN